MGAFEQLVAGQLFDSVLTPISAFIGTEILYVILWFGVLGIAFMKSKNWGLLMIVAMVTSVAIVPELVPGMQKYMIILIIGGVSFILYDIFRSRR